MNVQCEVGFNVVLYFHERLVILGGVLLLLLLLLSIPLVLESCREEKVIHWWLVDGRHLHVEVGSESRISLGGTASHLNLAWSWNSLIGIILVVIIVPHHVHILDYWLD